MNDLKKLDDVSLLNNLKALVAEEHKITTAILRHLKEVQRRRLYADQKCGSLFTYCVQVLGYSEGAAQRRIEAMRLIQEVPEVEEKIENGELSLSVAAQARTFFRQEEMSDPQEKRNILITLTGKTTRQAQRELMLLSHSPPAPKERTRPLPENQTEIRFIADSKLMEDLGKLKGLLAHSHPQMTWAELIRYMTQSTLKKIDPMAKAAKSPPAPAEKSQLAPATARPAQTPASEVTSPAAPAPKNQPAPQRRRQIPAAARRQVWQRDRGRCVQCGSQHALQIDHKKPYSQGGAHDPNNLELTCRGCNQRRAIKSLGRRSMDRYLNAGSAKVSAAHSASAGTLQLGINRVEKAREG